MLLVGMCFWETNTNVFHHPCGMVTPTLFDIVVIFGLKPTGKPFEPSKTQRRNLIVLLIKLPIAYLLMSIVVQQTQLEHTETFLSLLSSYLVMFFVLNLF